jgi:hypothetical protein
MRTLVATLAKEEELLRARKHLGYEALVAIVPQEPDAALLAALQGSGARIERVPGHDLLACLERLQVVLAEAHKQGEVRCAVDGGTGAMSQAAFLACLSMGVEAWFLLHKAVRLPVLKARPVRQRFPPEQQAVLRALAAPMGLEDLAAKAELPLPRVKEALLVLRKEGAVDADAARAAPTRLGHFLRAALA